MFLRVRSTQIFFVQVKEICYEFSNEKQLLDHLSDVILSNNDYKYKDRLDFMNYVVDIKAMESDQFSQNLIRL